MENNIAKKEDQQIVEPEEVDTLSFAISLVSGIPDFLLKIMHSENDDYTDLLYLAILWSMSLLAIRKKNIKRIKK